MAANRLSEFFSACGLAFPADQVRQFADLVEALLRWNRHRNLTAIVDPLEVYEKHLVDSLTLLPYSRNARRLLDIGSGAGFPALPLKIACPHLEVVTLEAVAKKVAFQRHAVRLLGLTGYTAVHGRAEDLTTAGLHAPPGFDLVTARALGSLPLLAGLAKPYLAPGGRLVAMKGGDAAAELQEQGERLAREGWILSPKFLTLPHSGAERCLVEMTLKSVI